MSKPEIRAYQDVLGVGDGGYDSGSEHELFPSLSEVENMDPFSISFIDVWSHEICAVLCSDVGLKQWLTSRKMKVRWLLALKQRRLLLSLNMQSSIRTTCFLSGC